MDESKNLRKETVSAGVDERGETALHRAARRGTVEELKRLLDDGQEIDRVNHKGNTALHIAACHRREEAAMHLLDQGADTKMLGQYDRSVLHIAAEEGSLGLIKYLLKHGQDVNQVDEYGDTALHRAAAFGKEEAARYLFENGADSKMLDRSGRNVLHMAAAGGSVELIKYLLEQGQDINQVDESGDTALHLAAAFGKEEAARYLFENGADSKMLGQCDRSVLHKAVEGGLVGLIKYLLEQGQDINQVDEYGDTALHRAAAFGKEEAARYLFENGADSKMLGQYDRSVLHWAAEKCSVELITYLLERGQNLNQKNENGDTALHRAVINGRKDVVKLLVDRGAGMDNINNDGESVLYSAARKRNSEVIDILLEHDDTLLEFSQESKETPACWAASTGNQAVLSLLLAFGASIGRNKKKLTDPNVLNILKRDSGYKDESEVKGSFPVVTLGSSRRDKQLLNAVRKGDLKLVKSRANRNKAFLKGNIQILLEACRWGHTAVVKYLLDNKEIPVYSRRIQRSTPMHEAARRGHVRVLKLLLEKDTLIDARNEALETPLHQAAKWGKWPAAAFLVKRGARVTTLDKNGNTPLDLAKQNDWEKVVKVLQSPSKALSSSKNDLASLQEVYDAVVLGAVDLDENVIRHIFVPQNVHGIRDLWVGHKLLEIARRFGKIPKELDGLRLMRKFYHAITGKLYSDKEIDTAEDILKSAREQGLLDEGGPAAIIGDHLTKAEISEKIGPMILDLSRRVRGLEDGAEEVRSAIHQIKQDIDKANKQSMYLAFLRLGLSFVPVAGGALGTSVEALGKILELMNASGSELGDLCGLTTSMIDAVHPLLTDGILKTDVEELQSLKERLSPQFIEALPRIPRSQFLNIVGACFERGMEELREILDEFLKEVRSNKEFLNSREAEEVKIEEIPDVLTFASQEDEEDHSSEEAKTSVEEKKHIEGKQEEGFQIPVPQSGSGEEGGSQIEEFDLQSSIEKREANEAIIRYSEEVRSYALELGREVEQYVNAGGEQELLCALKKAKESMKSMLDALKHLNNEKGEENITRKQ